MCGTMLRFMWVMTMSFICHSLGLKITCDSNEDRSRNKSISSLHLFHQSSEFVTRALGFFFFFIKSKDEGGNVRKYI